MNGELGLGSGSIESLATGRTEHYHLGNLDQITAWKLMGRLVNSVVVYMWVVVERGRETSSVCLGELRDLSSLSLTHIGDGKRVPELWGNDFDA